MGQTGPGIWYDNLLESQSTGYYDFRAYNNTLFPDSSVQGIYGNSSGGTELDYISTNNIGEVFDPKSYMYENQLTATDGYKVDSVSLPYYYNYVKETGAAPDTLIFDFYTGVSNGTIISGTFNANPTYGIPKEPFATVKYNYLKNKGIGYVGEYKYVLKPGDTANSNARVISVSTNGANGIVIGANDLFAFTVSFKPGYKYNLGDTIDERWSPLAHNLHSHFRIFEGLSTTKNAMYDYEEALSIPSTVRYNIDANWDGYFIPGTAWGGYNEVLWSLFYVEKIVNVIHNDAGINAITSPGQYICEGVAPVKVKLENYGHSKLNSAIINYSINGKVQSPVYWTGSLDSGNSEVVTLNSGYGFTNGAVSLIAYTTYPNGVKDSVSQNDSSVASIQVFANPQVNAGSPSSICDGSSITLGSSAVFGDNYSWSSNPAGFTSTSANPIVSPGSTTMYSLTVTQGSTGCSNNGSVIITVNPLPVAEWTVSNTLQNYAFKVKDSSLSSSSYAWDFGDGSSRVYGYREGHVFPKNQSYNIKLLVTNSNTCVGEKDSLLSVTVSGVAPVLPGTLGIDMYPNPASDQLNLKFNKVLNETVTIIITDQLGRTVASKQFDGKQSELQINVSAFAKGVYTINVQTNSNGSGKYVFVKN